MSPIPLVSSKSVRSDSKQRGSARKSTNKKKKEKEKIPIQKDLFPLSQLYMLCLSLSYSFSSLFYSARSLIIFTASRGKERLERERKKKKRDNVTYLPPGGRFLVLTDAVTAAAVCAVSGISGMLTTVPLSGLQSRSLICHGSLCASPSLPPLLLTPSASLLQPLLVYLERLTASLLQPGPLRSYASGGGLHRCHNLAQTSILPPLWSVFLVSLPDREAAGGGEAHTAL